MTLALTVNPVYEENITASICEGSVYNEHGFNESETGVYSQTFQAVNGCDSVVTLALTVNPVYEENITVSICEGSVYNGYGFNESEAGVYSQMLESGNGCDSIVTLILTVNPVYEEIIEATIAPGETYTEYGFNESEAGVYSHIFNSIDGCDSVITLRLSVNENMSLSAVGINESDIMLYPNPAKDFVRLERGEATESMQVVLFDINGRMVREYVFPQGQRNLEINLCGLPAGLYSVKAGNTSRKLIVE